MLVSSERKNDILIVRLEGELDHHHAEEIRDAIDEILEDTSIRHLVFDLTNLRFMDSSGIGVFMGRYKTISKRGGQACITNVNGQLARIMDVSGLYTILKPYGSVQEAINGIRGI